MKSKEVRNKSKEECLKVVAEKKKRLSDVRFMSASSKLKNTKEITNLRKDIARIKTILKEKQKNGN